MGLIIEDGKGTGKSVGVSDNNELLTHGVSVSEEHSANMDKGKAFSWIFSEDADANDDCIFYIKNTSEENLVVEGVELYVSGATEVYVEIGNEGTTTTGTTVSGKNLNAGSGNSPKVTAIKDGDVQSGGTLATGDEVKRFIFAAETTSKHYNFVADLIIPPQQTITIWSNTAAIVVKGTIVGYFYNPVH